MLTIFYNAVIYYFCYHVCYLGKSLSFITAIKLSNCYWNYHYCYCLLP
mgnify:CR=1 FL=1